jgi:hypothetical protein
MYSDTHTHTEFGGYPLHVTVTLQRVGIRDWRLPIRLSIAATTYYDVVFIQDRRYNSTSHNQGPGEHTCAHVSRRASKWTMSLEHFSTTLRTLLAVEGPAAPRARAVRHRRRRLARGRQTADKGVLGGRSRTRLSLPGMQEHRD